MIFVTELLFTDRTATSNDYNNTVGYVAFDADGDNSASYSTDTVGDNLYEGDETFQVHIGETQPSKCSAVSTNSQNGVTVTILEDDCKLVEDTILKTLQRQWLKNNTLQSFVKRRRRRGKKDTFILI